MANEISDKREKLKQQMARLLEEEKQLNIRENKARQAYATKLGGILVRAKLDHLSPDSMLGACIFLNETIKNNPEITKSWEEMAKQSINQKPQIKTTIALQFKKESISREIEIILREHGLRQNKIRKEWCGKVADLAKLKLSLHDAEFNLEVLRS